MNGERISESTVSKYVKHEGADPSLAAQAAQQGQELPAPKALVLQTLVQASLYENTLAKNTAVPTDGQLAAVHDAAVQQQFSASGTGHALDHAVTSHPGASRYPAELHPGGRPLQRAVLPRRRSG